MNTKQLLFIATLIGVCTACQTEKNASLPEFIEIDVTKKYPEKQIFLDDLANIQYVLPEVHDDFLYRGIPNYVTDDYIFIYEWTTNDILVFDHNGTPLYKFNKQGEGPEEYNRMAGNLVYDPKADELYIKTINKIQVYSVKGDYKRTLPLEEGTFISVTEIFDDKTLLCYDNFESFSTPFFLLSRENGQIIEEIDIRYEDKLRMSVRKTEGEMAYVYQSIQTNIAKVKDGFILTDHSIDSVFLYTKDKELIPVLKRTPPIASMDPYIYLNSYLETPSYLFMTAISTEFDWDTKKGFDETPLLLDRKDVQLYKQRILLKEYEGKEIFLSPGTQQRVSGNIDGMITISSGELQDALEDGKLSGRLKEIVSQMDEDANSLILFLRFR